MKADRRHELRESDLEHWLHTTKEFLNERGRYVLLVLIAVVVVVAGASMAIGSRTASQERAWQKRRTLDSSTAEAGRENLPVLLALSEESTDKTFAVSGMLEAGMRALKLAQTVDSPPDPELNDLARKAFEAALKRFANDSMAVGAVHAGLATVAENDFILSGDNTQKEVARKHLQAILDDPALATLPYRAVAEDRLAHLDRTFTRVQFAVTPEAQEPVTVPTPGPGKKLIKMRVGPDGQLVPVKDDSPTPPSGQ